MERVLELIGDWPGGYGWVAATLVVAYLYATFRYGRMVRWAADTITLAPISVKGGISKELGPREAGLIVRAQLTAIGQAFRRTSPGHASFYMADAVDNRFRRINTALVSVPLELGPSEIKVQEELVVKVGTVQIPAGAIANLFLALLRVLPVPFRRRYLASLIHVTLVSIGDETQLLVHREGPVPASAGGPTPIGEGPDGELGAVLVDTKTVKRLSDLTDLLRDAAFMILQVHGKALSGRNWRGMRCLVDGLDALDQHRRAPDEALIAKAKEHFAHAVAAGADNVEALYFYGAMLLLDRTRESIAEGSRVFLRALKTENQRLRALVHAGLANCYAQEFHRLGKREIGVLKRGQDHAEQARQDWMASGPDDLHPWILSTLALVQHVDEGTDETREEAKRRFLASADLYHRAIRKEPDNGIFHNNLGWVLLKLAEWGVDNLAGEGIHPELVGNPAETAERYLCHSLQLNPRNKLTHANLCLLYATRWFREKDGKKYLDRCRYHGLMAIQIDPNYINGHRDVALSLVRYGEFNEAYGYFEEALRLAPTIEKDQEIIDDVVQVLREMKVSDGEIRRWRCPDPRLLVPPGQHGPSGSGGGASR